MRYSIYIPNSFPKIRAEVIDQLTDEVGGCSSYPVQGFWKTADNSRLAEEITVIYCDSSLMSQQQVIEDIFNDAVVQLLDAGEESVLVERTDVSVSFRRRPVVHTTRRDFATAA